MSNTNNPPAFPTSFSGDYPTELVGGLTMRDYFAAKAMQGFAADPNGIWSGGLAGMAAYAYDWADAMMKARGEQ